MCLILFATRAHPRYPLIVAANRDEAYARPSATAGYWQDAPQVYGGRDLDQGGTWLALNLSGRFAAITNYRQGVPRAPTKHSRGELTRGFLTGAETPRDYLQDVKARAEAYNGFSLIAGTLSDLWFYSNRGADPQPITPGVHGLSNHLLDEPWPKVERGVALLQSLLQADEPEITQRLLDELANASASPDELLPSTGIALERERALSSSFIVGDSYGTRASTLLMIDSQARALFVERTFGPGGVFTGETRERFSIVTDCAQSSSTGSGASLSSIAR